MTGARGQRIASATLDRTWQPIPYQRLQAVDLYHMIDWVREGWSDDELQVTPRLQRLSWHLEELPEPHRTRALEQYATVTRARIVSNVPWSAALTQLRRIVSEWSADRADIRLST